MNTQQKPGRRHNLMTVAELLDRVTHARLSNVTSMGRAFATRRSSAEWRRVLAPSQLDLEVVVERDEYHGVSLLKSADGNDDVGRVERADEGTLYRR
jgi:hypothetical protein